ncbi:Peptidase family S41 [Chishuiella changwenlii]|uniref:Peptidase family S41 n=1 Tax=Chishuiella changwenlii TaxID=1434701 RepID=A0A1M6T5A9_9FLAO|nr:S41 family peptidase [Chishuiella changwenlii]GGE94924.1 hypothetical protein GCM10010984_10600 [Chishuiella changwenlii]SHK52151.1 Peptidase family S41 [Chishuiella changwenlii]
MKKAIKRFLFLGLSILSSILVFNSCVNNDDLSITEPTRYTIQDIKSYSDLFDVFWTTMDQRYNYFHEQKRRDGMNWNSIYSEYSPKFKALKTFGRATDDEKEIYEDYLKAKQYFQEIIDPIIDKHFYVNIYLEKNNKNSYDYTKYSGGMLSQESENNTYPFISKYGYMKDRVLPGSFISEDFAIGGYLNSNSDIYYFAFSDFQLANKFQIQLKDKYLTPDNGGGLYLTVDKIDNSKELNSIQDVATRKKVRDFTVNLLNEWNKFPKSEEVATFNNEITKFKATEIVSDQFVNAATKALDSSYNLVDYQSGSVYTSVLTYETLEYIVWFRNNMYNHVMVGHALGLFQMDIYNALNKVPFYKQFLNPLHSGEIKKLILDLRSNDGGLVLDARFFSDRFITKNEIFGYQRTKEGNGQFNYTPWIEMRTNPHQFNIPSSIPIAILTDKESMSMSEITTLMLKSQGNHVMSIGDYSIGATAGLGISDDFNGGLMDGVASSRLNFYMPLMAFKDAKGEVIEGIGVRPDIYVTPPTNEELTAMQTSPTTFVDRVLNEAIKYLSSK